MSNVGRENPIRHIDIARNSLMFGMPRTRIKHTRISKSIPATESGSLADTNPLYGITDGTSNAVKIGVNRIAQDRLICEGRQGLFNG